MESRITACYSLLKLATACLLQLEAALQVLGVLFPVLEHDLRPAADSTATVSPRLIGWLNAEGGWGDAVVTLASVPGHIKVLQPHTSSCRWKNCSSSR